MESEPEGWQLPRLLSCVRNARHETQEERDLADKCQRYYDGDQWTHKELQELNRRGQPAQVHNRIRKKVDFYLGLEQSRRTDPKAYPRNSRMTVAAEIATEIIRTNCDRFRFARIRSECFRDMMLGPAGVVVQGVSDDGTGQLVTTARRVRWRDFIWDPQSYEADFSDASFLGFGRWVSETELGTLFPETKGTDTFATSKVGDDSLADFDDPVTTRNYWYDAKTKRVYLVTLYYLDAGEWRFTTFVAGGVLEAGLSPFRTDKGKTFCPITAQSIFVGRDLDRHGPVKDMLSPQDGINKRASKMLAILSSTAMFAEKGTFESNEKARRERAKLDGFIEVNPGAKIGENWGFIENAADLAGHARLFEMEMAEMNAQGANPALGASSNPYQSARAVQAQQQAGFREENERFDALNEWTLAVYRKDWWLSRQFYSDDRIIRIAAVEDAPKFIRLNEPSVRDTPFGLQAGLRNAPALIDVDIVLDTAPDSVTIRQEQFAAIMDVMGKTPPQTWPMMLPVFMRLGEFSTDVRREVEELLKGDQSPEAQQAQAAQQELAMREQQAKVADREGSAALKRERAFDQRVKALQTLSKTQGNDPEHNLEIERLRFEIARAARESAAGNTGDAAAG